MADENNDRDNKKNCEWKWNAFRQSNVNWHTCNPSSAHTHKIKMVILQVFNDSCSNL